MTRYLHLEHDNLYQHYSKIGKQLAELSRLPDKKNVLDKNKWALITNEGVWKLPIPKQYGGIGLSWKESIIAIAGLASSYQDNKFLSSIITQFSILYLIAHHGKEIYKKLYLSCLMQGKISFILKAGSENNLIKLNKIPSISNNDGIANFIIYIASHSKSKIEFYTIHDNKKKTFISTSKGAIAFCDFINFERLLYGYLAISLLRPLIDQFNETPKNLSRITEEFFEIVKGRMIDSLRISRKIINKSIAQLNNVVV
ncbi:MAG: hypothetical protein A3E87_06490 [Gammaproteobacteria bacterium RIFCSPHIGHO2_12_FULL_35_23]|nr:MAG: hypothetical protein A3E87_06490 [Gammaproteobacteria bacterium RIFCSPHIGHO2_12_FULL_35_23]HLB43196.1 acyl-CoA dehydrogenase family protein [Gammaproteobacteria bacterium]